MVFDKFFAIKRLSYLGFVQLVADLEYIHNIITALASGQNSFKADLSSNITKLHSIVTVLKRVKTERGHHALYENKSGEYSKVQRRYRL